MKTLTIELPDTVDVDDKDARMYLAARLYEKGKLTLGQAADIVGYSKETFMELLGEYGVSFFNYPSEELEDDLKNAESHSS
jgi:predicted HTH domain antitoxin